MFGSKESPLMPTRLLSKGFAIASLDYRLSGDAIFPAALEDCKSAVRWLRAHAAEHNLDTDRVIAWGESAGAHQASMLGVTCASARGDDFDVGDHLDVSSAVAGVVAYYGPTDFLQMDKQVSQSILPWLRTRQELSRCLGCLPLWQPKPSHTLYFITRLRKKAL